MGNKISNELLDQGFFSALGTTEHAGGDGRGHIVKRDKPFTWDYNNGVTAVYDEEGRPWIKLGYGWSGGRAILHITGCEKHLVRGAHVPHSNDGGEFIREVLPKL